MLRIIKKIVKNEDTDAVLIGAGYSKSFSYRSGAEKGPAEIFKVLNSNLEVYDRFTDTVPSDIYMFDYFNIPNINKLSPEKAVEVIAQTHNGFNDKFMLMLGGTHVVSIGAFDYYSKEFNPKEVTILQIDAHPDLRNDTSDYKEPNKIDHACVMRRGHEMGYNIVQVGIRTISIFDHKYIQENKNIKCFEWGRGPQPTVNEIIDSIKTDKVYLTIDIDGLDPAHAPATGTPVPGGLEWSYTQSLIRRLIEKKNLIGADIVEVAPFDDDVLTQYTAAALCYDVLSYKLLKRDNKLKFI
jgi:agmatinase